MHLIAVLTFRKLYWVENGDILRKGSYEAATPVTIPLPKAHSRPTLLTYSPEQQKHFFVTDGKNIKGLDEKQQMLNLITVPEGVKYIAPGPNDNLYYITNDNNVSLVSDESQSEGNQIQMSYELLW